MEWKGRWKSGCWRVAEQAAAVHLSRQGGHHGGCSQATTGSRSGECTGLNFTGVGVGVFPCEVHCYLQDTSWAGWNTLDGAVLLSAAWAFPGLHYSALLWTRSVFVRKKFCEACCNAEITARSRISPFTCFGVFHFHVCVYTDFPNVIYIFLFADIKYLTFSSQELVEFF